MLDDNDDQVRRAIRAQVDQDVAAFVASLGDDVGSGVPPPPQIKITEVSSQPYQFDRFNMGVDESHTERGGGGGGIEPPPEPNICDCLFTAAYEIDGKQWFEPDPEPDWPDTWDSAYLTSEDEFNDSGSGCNPYSHTRIRVRFRVTDSPIACTLRWAVETYQNPSGGGDPIITDEARYIAVTPGTHVYGPFEIPSPGAEGPGLVDNCPDLPLSFTNSVVYPFTPASERGACMVGETCFMVSQCECENILGGTWIGGECPP